MAQTDDEMDASFKREIARWQVQQTAAERDVRLVDQVRSAFYTETKLSSGASQASKANAALAPLRTRYPDYRLSYKNPGDYCRVSRAIDAARSAALTRMNTSLTHQMKVLALSQSYHQILIKMLAGDLLGQSLRRSDVVDAFQGQLAEDRSDEVETDWGGMDTLMEPAAGEEDCS